MELGIGLPTSGALAAPANIAAVAKEAERLGYDALWTYERLLRPIGDVEQGGGKGPLPETYRLVFEPLETLSYVAALTSTIRLGTSVVNALMHPPVVLARRFATLDQLSGGRAIAGFGQGWMQEEFDTVGVPKQRLGAGFDEVVAAIRACWGPDPVEHQGRYYTIAPSEVNPKPVQRPLPILMGSISPAGIKRAARIADGLNPIAFSADALRETVTAFRDAARELGRDADALPVVARANVPITPDPLGDDRPYLGGSPAQIADALAALEDSGVDQVLLNNTASTDLDTELRLLERIRAEYGKRG